MIQLIQLRCSRYYQLMLVTAGVAEASHAATATLIPKPQTSPQTPYEPR